MPINAGRNSDTRIVAGLAFYLLVFVSALSSQTSVDPKVAPTITQLISAGHNLAYAYYTKENGLIDTVIKWYVYDGRDTMGPYDHIDTIFYTVDATLAYKAENDGKWYVYSGKKNL